MCRSIKTLRGLEPLATGEEVRAASLQFVRKVSGYRQPSARNRVAFDRAVEEVSSVITSLLAALPPAQPGNGGVAATAGSAAIPGRTVPPL